MITKRDFKIFNCGFGMTPCHDRPGEYKALHFFVVRRNIGADCYIDADFLAQPIYPEKTINRAIAISMDAIEYREANG